MIESLNVHIRAGDQIIVDEIMDTVAIEILDPNGNSVNIFFDSQSEAVILKNKINSYFERKTNGVSTERTESKDNTRKDGNEFGSYSTGE